MPYNPLSPKSDQDQISLSNIHTLSRDKFWELIKWSLKRKCLDLLSNSRNLFFKEMYRDQFGEFVCGYWGLKGIEQAKNRNHHVDSKNPLALGYWILISLYTDLLIFSLFWLRVCHLVLSLFWGFYNRAIMYFTFPPGLLSMRLQERHLNTYIMLRSGLAWKKVLRLRENLS